MFAHPLTPNGAGISLYYPIRKRAPPRRCCRCSARIPCLSWSTPIAPACWTAIRGTHSRFLNLLLLSVVLFFAGHAFLYKLRKSFADVP